MRKSQSEVGLLFILLPFAFTTCGTARDATSLERGLYPMEVTSIAGHKTIQMLKNHTHLEQRI
jgi:hypothetical protein